MEEVQQLVSHLGRKYSGTRYSIISKNCNHFTKEFCLMLCGRSIPRWVNRLANGINHVPVLRHIVERSMGLPNVVSQCCGSGMINTVDSSETLETQGQCWSANSLSSATPT
ncbi:unnamed protein product, partial [Allacma fusca]